MKGVTGTTQQETNTIALKTSQVYLVHRVKERCDTNTKALITDPCKPEVRPGAREESASPVWLAAPAMNANDTTKGIYGGLTLDVDRHYIRNVTATAHQEKGIIILDSNPSRGTVLPAPHGKGNKCDKNVKYKRTDALSLWHQQ